ncbi:hypothetical protein HU200_037482 [Digitaria exilis]|uniref:EF-hand domain-containing protein n=1 Tax=Digitaria exilis TaxID=1010633 RepID=A0A835BBG8_9POAL|nr:hypothetical protein HU200_037482 [Digitaria exilis]
MARERNRRNRAKANDGGASARRRPPAGSRKGRRAKARLVARFLSPSPRSRPIYATRPRFQHHQTPNPPSPSRSQTPRCRRPEATVLHDASEILRGDTSTTTMEMASAASAPSTSFHFHISLAQAVLTLSINAILVFLTAIIKSSSSSSPRRREAAPAPTTTAAAAPPAPSPAKPAAIDMDVVLGVMGAAGATVSVGFEEAAALFEEEEATVEEARAAFAVFDRDGDGFIGAAELGSVLKSLGLGAAADAECQRMIDAYDEDKDGRIDFHEFVKLMETSS